MENSQGTSMDVITSFLDKRMQGSCKQLDAEYLEILQKGKKDLQARRKQLADLHQVSQLVGWNSLILL